MASFCPGYNSNATAFLSGAVVRGGNSINITDAVNANARGTQVSERTRRQAKRLELVMSRLQHPVPLVEVLQADQNALGDCFQGIVRNASRQAGMLHLKHVYPASQRSAARERKAM